MCLFTYDGMPDVFFAQDTWRVGHVDMSKKALFSHGRIA